jgi:phage baseplate assembly protein gpV
MKLTKSFSILIVSSVVFFQSSLQADNSGARIVKVQGQVYVVNAKGEKREANADQFMVNSNETVVTSKNSKAVMQFNDGTTSVLDQKSSLRVEQSGWLSQLGGKVYYVFRKVFGKEKPKRVATKFSTIGIRGTTFIVDANEGAEQVALLEGKLNLESPDGDYEIHKPVSEAEGFAAYQEQQRKARQALDTEYKDYKKNINKDFIEYKKSFDLEANKVVSFNGNRVNESDLNTDWKSSFEEFADFSKDHMHEYESFKQEE